MAKNRGYDMQPEFGKNNSSASMVNYTKIKSAGEVQDELRKSANKPMQKTE